MTSCRETNSSGARTFNWAKSLKVEATSHLSRQLGWWAQSRGEDSAEALAESRLVHQELVGIGSSLDYGLPQSVEAVDLHEVFMASFCLACEEDTTHADVSAYHLHDADRESDGKGDSDARARRGQQ